MIPKTKGYECIVKIAESALDGDTKKAKHFIKKYMIMYPDSDLIYPFTHLLAGNLNPDGLTISNSDGNYSPIAKLVWSYLKYTECDINGEHTTLIESKEVWEMIKALEFHIHDELMRLKKLARIFKEDDQFLKDSQEQPSQTKTELEILHDVKRMFMFHSDYSTQCNGYRSLLRKIEEFEKEQPSQPVGEVKSAEQLFNAYRKDIEISESHLSCLLKDDAIKAIHAYHNQFPKVVLPSEFANLNFK